MVNETINKKHLKRIEAEIKKDFLGLSITQIFNITKIKKCQIRIILAYLMGTHRIVERPIGMAKLYYSK